MNTMTTGINGVVYEEKKNPLGGTKILFCGRDLNQHITSCQFFFASRLRSHIKFCPQQEEELRS